MNFDEIHRHVRCCVCDGRLGRVLNGVSSERQARWQYPTVGNVLTGDAGEAIAFVCDACIGRPLVRVVEFPAAGGVVYHAVADLAPCERREQPEPN